MFVFFLGFQLVTVCSKYSFHEERIDWKRARERCGNQENSSLVSMETEREWHFVMNLTKKRKKERWFIGLKIVDGSHAWCWLSGSIAYVNESSSGTWRWTKGEPNNFETEKCVEMLQYGKYNNIRCQAQHYDNDPGYNCEKQVSKFMIMPKLC